jgi:SSS family solute:Na+ symporter/sodium/pantothenate symporter
VDVGIELSAESGPVLAAFGCYLLGVALLGVFSHRYLSRGSFVKEYFLGNRGLGAWVLALTVAATAISGGTFMGFPSLIYSNGWIMSLWIASYMVVPLTTMVLLGKRINQVGRIAGAVTVPDVLRDRFESPALGVVATLLLLLFLPFNLVAQFKAGGLVMREALGLRPAEAAFAGAEVDEKQNLIVKFRLPNGSEESQRTPLPSESARYLPDRTSVNSEEREVLVRFEADGRETTKRVKFPPARVTLPVTGWRLEQGYLFGLLIFALTVVAYTTYGGFWAVTWTDVLEGIVMLVGVVLMAFLAVQAVPPLSVPTGDGTGQAELHGLSAATAQLWQQDPRLVYGPGPNNFLPIGLGFSFFLMWSLMSPGQPSGMVRLMSFRDTPSLRRALVLIGGYYALTYLSLLVIFICARAIFPTEYLREIGSEGEPDSIMPAMIRHVTRPLAGGSFVAGLLLAAPYAAIMSTVAAFLLMISSSLVRDLYQRTINPDVSEQSIKRISYLATALVGVVVVIGALNPPTFLQYIIVFTGSGQGCAFLLPMALSLYWRRATRQGMLASMVGGFLTLFGLYALGWIDSAREVGPGEPGPLQQFLDWGTRRPDAFAPLYVGGLDPLVWGLLTSATLAVVVSLLTRPDEVLVKKYFPS